MDDFDYFSIRYKNKELTQVPDDGSVDSAVNVLEWIRAGATIKLIKKKKVIICLN